MVQVYDYVNRHLLIKEIEDHRINEEAIPMNQGTFKTKSGLNRKIRPTKGWELYVRRKDGSGDWINMKDLKD